MTYSQAILLGTVQGLGEFLPISSSAHLAITPWLFGFQDQGTTYDVALHFGTLIALISFFWRDWVDIIFGFLRSFKKDVDGNERERNLGFRRLFLFLMVASVPGAIAGKLLEKHAEELKHPLMIAINMAVLGALLWYADRKNGEKGEDIEYLSFGKSMVIGLSQAVALLRGVSRSGSTMTAGLLLGLNRESAARFSFLMAMPITVGACLLKTREFLSQPLTGPSLVGIGVSALVGFLSIKYLLKFVRTFSFKIFVYYRFLFAIVVISIYLIRQA